MRAPASPAPRRGTQYRATGSGEVEAFRETIRVPKPVSGVPRHRLGSSPPSQLPSLPQRMQKQASAQQLPVRAAAPAAVAPPVVELSEATKQRVTAAKQYIYEYYVGWFKYVNQRSARLAMLEKEVRLMPGDTGERRRLEHYAKESRYLRQRRRKMKLGEFQLLSVLGKGAFGVVYLARKRDTGEVVAVKKLSKEQFDATNRDRVVREKKVLESASNSPWLVGLSYAFQDKEHLYLAMEYVPGGDVRNLLSNIGVLEEWMARFYLIEMIAAVSVLHKLGYTHRCVSFCGHNFFADGLFCYHRDLKPDNFLIAHTGHLKLGDFGLSKQVRAECVSFGPLCLNLCNQGLELQYKETLSSFRGGLTMTSLAKELDFKTRLQSYQQQQQKKLETKKGASAVGSPDYMAVEILRGAQYNFSVDWWSIGVIYYEMLAGLPPFYADNPMNTYANILEYPTTLKFPELVSEEGEEAVAGMSQEAWLLVNAFLTEPNKRLGRDGLPGIMRHEYFADVEWETLRDQEAPFKPELESETDTSYFVVDESLPVRNMSANDDEGGSMSSPQLGSPRRDAQPQQAFLGFTYKGEMK